MKTRMIHIHIEPKYSAWGGKKIPKRSQKDPKRIPKDPKRIPKAQRAFGCPKVQKPKGPKRTMGRITI